MHLVVPERYRPVLLSEERYARSLAVAGQRPGGRALGRASVLSGVDVATLEASLEQTIVGVTPLDETCLLSCPGPTPAAASSE